MFWELGTVLAVGGLLSLVASPLLYQGWKHRDRYQLIRETPTATSAAVDDGQTVLLTGVVQHSGHHVTAPVSGTDTLLAAWDVSRWVKEGVASQRYWRPEARGITGAGFVLLADDREVRVPQRTRQAVTDDLRGFFAIPDTETGVDVDDTSIEVESFDTEISLRPTDGPPEHLQDLTDRLQLDQQPQKRELLPITRAHGTRRFRELTVEEGQQLTIRATVRFPQTPDGQLRITTPDESPILVSTLSPSELSRRYRWGYWKRFHGVLLVIAVIALGVTAALLL